MDKDTAQIVLVLLQIVLAALQWRNRGQDQWQPRKQQKKHRRS